MTLALMALGNSPTATAEETNPFAGVEAKPVQTTEKALPWWKRFFAENFGFRKELMFETGATDDEQVALRQSVGFEVIKKFSTKTKTLLGFDFQGRLVMRDNFIGFPNDMEGVNRQGLYPEYHNAYVDLYDVVPTHGRNVSVNIRAGHFYVPFGINVQTDTHGTIWQLSNERNFGWDRDWGIGLWGNASRHVRYDVFYLVGSGFFPKFEGQAGLGAVRIGLANRFLSEYGLEGGVSFIGGQRLSNGHLATLRGGLDLRWRHDIPRGLVMVTTELSGGTDAADALFTQLYQFDWLHSSRRFGATAQFRWFWQAHLPSSTDSDLLLQATWYLSNDVAGSNLHWLALNADIQLQRQQSERTVVWTLQYYRYW
jgi:hypothetical protein